MSDPRRHKAFVFCTDDEWRAFHAVCIASGVKIQDALADLVRQTNERAGVKIAPAIDPAQTSLDDAIAGPVAGASIKRRRELAKSKKAEANKRSPAKKKGRPTR